MKTKTLTVLLTLLSLISFGQQWTGITNDTPAGIQAKLLSATESQITISIEVPGFYTSQVVTPRGEASLVSIPKAVNNAPAGNPNLPMFPVPTIIGDKALMQVTLVEADYIDFENVEIAPSKGDFPRTIDPDDVPYTYGEVYQQNAFFPSQPAILDEPYIHRDVRGQNMMVTPMAYNPATNTLRVYKHLVLSMVKIGEDNRNIITSRSKSMVLDPEFKAMYQSRYINYQESMAKYNAIEENGELLVICHDDFLTAMEPFVAWKKQIGRPTTMVGTSTTGNNATALKTYITDYYNNHPNLTDVLLVGDVAQIPGSYVSAGSGSSGYSGYGDLPYGQTVGNDSYNEVIVGRFCCETEAQVINHVNKVLNYERDMDETATWLTVGQGVSTNSQAGHNNEIDYQHIDNIRIDLLNYNYTDVYRDYQGVNGTTAANASVVSQHINGGVSIINYCNHGSETSWGVFGYSNSHVNALTNDYKLPYIISVACLNGKYDHYSGCFAEAWMRATNNSNGNPTGAIGGMFSYISQPWTPPQYGQDEMIDILVESKPGTIRHTMGGVSVNGNLKVLDLGANSNPNKGTYNCWILFGDPTLTLRNAVPTVMAVNAPMQINTTATSLTLTATDADGALATLTLDGEIMGTATIESGTATITFDAPGADGTATLTVFGYNKKTYSTTVNIGSGSGPEPITANATAVTPIITLGGSTQLNVTATGGDGTYTYSWTPAESLDDPNIASPTATPDTTTVYTCIVTSAGLSSTTECTISVVCPPVNVTATVQDEVNVQLNWNVAGPSTTFIIYRDDTMVTDNVMRTSWTDTNLEPGTYSYRIAANYFGTVSPLSDEAIVTIETQMPVTCPAPENYTGEYYWENQEFGARLAWDRAEYEFNLDRFEIYRSADNENFKLIKRIVNTPSITHYECVDVLEVPGVYIYRIIAFYQNNCESDPLDIDLTITDIDESRTRDVTLYPNPTQGEVTVTSEGLKQIQMVNHLGQIVSQIHAEDNNVTVDLSSLGKGLYMMLIHTGNGIVSKKIIVQ